MAGTRTNAAAWLAKWLPIFGDNQYQNITEKTFRDKDEDIAATFMAWKDFNPNGAPGIDKRVRFETAAQLATAGGAGDCLEGQDDETFCLGMLAWVEFPEVGPYGTSFRLMYDGNPARTPGDNGVWAYRTGTLVTGSRLPAIWVKLSDPIAGVPTYDYLQTIAGAGGYAFKVGEPIRDFAGTNAEYFFAALQPGPLPAPTAATGDVNWRRIAPEEVATVAPPFFLRISQATAILLDDDVAVQAGVRYAVEFPSGQCVELVGTEARRFPVVGVLNGEPVRVNVHTGAITPADYDDTAVRGLITALQTGKVEVWTVGPVFANRTYLGNGFSGWGFYQPKNDIGTSTTISSAYYNLVVAWPKLYSTLGLSTDGGLTRFAATQAFSTKANLYNAPYFANETAPGATLFPGMGGGQFYSLNGTEVSLDDPAAYPETFGRVNFYRAVGQAASTLKLIQPTTASIEGSSSLILEPGEWLVLRQVLSGYQIPMRGNNLGAAAPGGGSTTMLSEHYTATVAGAQPAIARADAVAYFDVSVNGEALVPGLHYTVSGNTLTLLAAAGVDVGEVVAFSYFKTVGTVVAPATDDPDLHTTTSGNRHTGPDTYFTPRTAFNMKAVDNVASVNYQVSYRDTTNANAWVYGTPRATEAAATADLGAVPAASWAQGVQLRYETVPTDSTKEAQFATNVS
ncbi:hypothetical protein Q5H92_22840 [Hymenobacter sp. M29]|uniref:DUF4815 domain-containing protein n=1 Tax=Hymenobacter mellowenesis TaxID=3063995 RepID=A0ABT9AHA6_9BACT|nr:hypothetical protein [Hymenobacter sp. M29]MDO7849219.1 hypothetical protein [Hymenobacter sp. M29]